LLKLFFFAIIPIVATPFATIIPISTVLFATNSLGRYASFLQNLSPLISMVATPLPTLSHIPKFPFHSLVYKSICNP